MKEKLIQLHTALSNINTKGYDTLLMADCLTFLSQLIEEEATKVANTTAETKE